MDNKREALKRSRYFRVSLTNKCNNSCYSCHKEGNNGASYSELSRGDTELACRVALDFGFRKIKLTGGEPTIHPDILGIIETLSAMNIPDFSMITNGTTLDVTAEDLWRCGLRRLNVTLNTLRQERMDKIQAFPSAAANVSRIVRGIEKAIRTGFGGMKINFVFLGEESAADLDDLLRFTGELGLMLVVLPVIEDNSHYTLDYLYEKLRSYGIANEEVQPDGEGIIRRIITLNSGSRVLLRCDELSEREPYVFCGECGRRKLCREGIFPLRLSSSGELIPCAAGSAHRISLRDALDRRDEEAVRRKFAETRLWYTSERV